MFMGPFGQSCAWNTNGLSGARRFLDRVWNLSDKILPLPKGELEGVGALESSKKVSSLFHKTIKKVSEDIPEFKYNTCVSQMMIFLNTAEEEKSISKEDFAKFILILSPFAPHLAEEIWEKLGHNESIFKSTWPEYDKELIKDDVINLVVQINGKLRATIELPADISQDAAKTAALENEVIKKWLEGKEIVKVIFVPGKLINIVVK